MSNKQVNTQKKAPATSKGMNAEKILPTTTMLPAVFEIFCHVASGETHHQRQQVPA
jgi:hypothetical protein